MTINIIRQQRALGLCLLVTLPIHENRQSDQVRSLRVHPKIGRFARQLVRNSNYTHY